MSASSNSNVLNVDRRPQRLYLKVQNAMKVVDKVLANCQYTGIKEYLGEADFMTFRQAVRGIIRHSFDASMDSWPVRAIHDYMPDARNAILQAVQERPELFVVPGGDEFVPSGLVYDSFYTGPRPK